MSFGSDLRQHREARGMTLAQIAAATKVSERHLRALEADHYAELPGGVFNRGIVRSTCLCLELDPEDWTSRFAAQHASESAERDWKSFAENAPATRAPTGAPDARWWGVLGLLVALVALSWAAWHFLLHPRLGRSKTAPSTPALGLNMAPRVFAIDIGRAS